MGAREDDQLFFHEPFVHSGPCNEVVAHDDFYWCGAKCRRSYTIRPRKRKRGVVLIMEHNPGNIQKERHASIKKAKIRAQWVHEHFRSVGCE